VGILDEASALDFDVSMAVLLFKADADASKASNPTPQGRGATRMRITDQTQRW
jgi:hypothetical protein